MNTSCTPVEKHSTDISLPTPDQQDLLAMALQIESMLGTLMSNQAFAEAIDDPWAGTIWAAKDMAKRLKQGIDKLPVVVPDKPPVSPKPPVHETMKNKRVTELPEHYAPELRRPEDVFILPQQASSEDCIGTLEEQLLRLGTMLRLMQIDNLDPAHANGFSVDDRQAQSAFDQCLSTVRFSQLLVAQVAGNAP